MYTILLCTNNFENKFFIYEYLHKQKSLQIFSLKYLYIFFENVSAQKTVILVSWFLKFIFVQYTGCP